MSRTPGEFDEKWLRPGAIVMVDTPTTGALVREIQRLRLENAELRRDAERYRWLRERPSLIGWDWWVVKVPKDTWIDEKFLDAAIDQAIAGEEK